MATNEVVGTISTEKTDEPRDEYIFNVLDYGATRSTDGSNLAADSTAAFQAWADAITSFASTGTTGSGARGVIPPGWYVIEGTVTFQDGSLSGNVAIEAHGARISHRPSANNVTMFQTRDLVDHTDAGNTADDRDMWRWSGGWFSGQALAGQVGFHLKVANRFHMRDVFFNSFDTSVLAEASLHFRMSDCRINNPQTYGVHVIPGQYAGATNANSSGHAGVIDNVRFFGAPTANIRIEHTQVRVQNCTFEGGNPVDNIDYFSTNNSAIFCMFENLWCENQPTNSHIKVETNKGVVCDWQAAINGLAIDCVNAQQVHVRRLPMVMGFDGAPLGSPRFRNQAAAGRYPRWYFEGTGDGLNFDPTETSNWDLVGGNLPQAIQATGAFHETLPWMPQFAWRTDLDPVDGTRADGQALENLLTQLDQLGLISNQTTAGTVLARVFYEHNTSTGTHTAGTLADFTELRADNNGAGDISLNGTNNGIVLAADTGTYRVTVWGDTESPLAGDATTLEVLVNAAAFSYFRVDEPSSQTGSWMDLIDTTGASQTIEINRSSVTGSGRLDVKVEVEQLG